MARSIFLGLYRANLLILASIGLAATLAAGCEYSSPRRAISASAMSAGNDIVQPRWAQRVHESIARYVTVYKAMATGLAQACFSPGRAIFVLVYSNSALLPPGRYRPMKIFFGP